MPRQQPMTHRFVEYVPDDMEDGVLYVSIPFATATHRCCCGCGHEVVTPLTPTDWSVVFDGDTVSLTPSIGNWSFPCRSHYWIRQGRVVWARTWTDHEVAAGRLFDAMAKEQHYQPPAGDAQSTAPPPTKASHKNGDGLLAGLRRWFGGGRGKDG